MGVTELAVVSAIQIWRGTKIYGKVSRILEHLREDGDVFMGALCIPSKNNSLLFFALIPVLPMKDWELITASATAPCLFMWMFQYVKGHNLK